MTELYEHVRSQPDAEATEIFRQIRLTPDPFTVLQNIRNGKLSLQRTVPKLQSVVFMRQLDAEALQQSRIRVRARPWTSVVGDGIVSHLLTRALQHHQLVFIDEEALTTDMLAQHERTPYCSALLVNVLCLLGTVGVMSFFAVA
jgi:plasmid stability protein